ncbi:MAG TPA: hypothetical protein VN687_18925 [Blastocatellia bacterium]|nr:hypothetical protein [Blastocatellia bacterium]
MLEMSGRGLLDFCKTVPTSSIHRIQKTHVALYHIMWDMVHTFLEDNLETDIERVNPFSALDNRSLETAYAKRDDLLVFVMTDPLMDSPEQGFAISESIFACRTSRTAVKQVRLAA